MATINTTDTIESAALEQSGEGYNVTRRFLVEGITGATGPERCLDALSASGIPAYGAACPGASPLSSLKVVSRSVEPISMTQAWVNITYRRPTRKERPEPTTNSEAPTRRLGASVEAQDTNKDASGALMTVVHNSISQVATVSVQKPTLSLSFDRKEIDNPEQRAKDYVGKVNDDTWEGGAAGTWLCTRIDSSTDNDGVSYNVSYEFLYNAATWNATVYWTDEDGRPPFDLDPLIGIKSYAVYPEADFTALDLS